jgi:hypothetical protein
MLNAIFGVSIEIILYSRYALTNVRRVCVWRALLNMR